MAITKTRAWDDVYAKLGTQEGEEKIFRIAKACNKATKDLTQIKQMKDQEGSVLTDENQIRERWKGYFETLLNEENPRMVTGDGTPNQGMTTEVTRTEVQKALRKMKNGKSPGPDEIPVEAWKCLGREGIDKLTELMQKIWREERMPEDSRNSVITPIFKEKGDIQDCGNYQGIKLMSHTMNIWEKIIDGQIRGETSIEAKQFGFMLGRRKMDAVFSLRVIMEKYREGQKGLHMVFIDLEKAYDWVPRQEVWRCMREKGVPEKYVKIIQDMYNRVKTHVWCSVGEMEKFPVKVGLHQGSALSPYLFNLIMDVISAEVRDEVPLSMLLANDIVLSSSQHENVEKKLEEWRKVMEERGLKISRRKTEHLQYNKGDGCIRLQDQELN